MDRQYLRRVLLGDVDRLLEFLSQRQFLEPHVSIQKVLERAIDQFGLCPAAVEKSLQWMRFDGNLAIGRLRRTELNQLGRSLHRYWRQNAAQVTAAHVK